MTKFINSNINVNFDDDFLYASLYKDNIPQTNITGTPSNSNYDTIDDKPIKNTKKNKSSIIVFIIIFVIIFILIWYFYNKKQNTSPIELSLSQQDIASSVRLNLLSPDIGIGIRMRR